MAADLEDLSIAELEALISSRKSKLSALYDRRDQLLKQLSAIELEIAAAEGRHTNGKVRPEIAARSLPAANPRGPVPRAINQKSLKKYVEEALAANKRGLTIAEIQEVVLASGYTTTSSNFKNTLYQCLYHNGKTFVHDKKTRTYKLNK